MSELLHFSEHTLQEVALVFMAVVYTTRIMWLLRFKAGKERQAPTGIGDPKGASGYWHSLFVIAMPWSMESARNNLGRYLQFVIFHLGVASAIALSFIIPYAPQLLNLSVVVYSIQIITAAACVVGILRMLRRVRDKTMRAISTPDDIFSLALLTVWLGVASLSSPNSLAWGEWPLLAFFILTAVFLIYVPFSKISHYLYYPFTRFYFGKSMGRRGVYPLVPSVKPSMNEAQPQVRKAMPAAAEV